MHRILLAERHLLVVAVNRRGGAKHKGLHIHLPGKFQHRLRARNVRMRAVDRTVDGGPHAGLGRKVNDGVDRRSSRGAFQRLGVVDVLFVEVEIRATAEVGDALLFDGAVVVRVEVVDRRDDMPLVQKTPTEMPADKPGATGNENVHDVQCDRSLGVKYRGRSTILQALHLYHLAELSVCVLGAGLNKQSPNCAERNRD